MRILISGGEKSINIVNGIRSKFIASGDEFIVIPYIEDIPSLYAKGDTFDKALITMESITRDNFIKDEMQLRNRINAFALDASKRVKKSLYVFLSPIEEIANIMQEETLSIERYTAVLLKAKPYSVQFFVDILVKDVAQIPEGLIYKPTLIGAEQSFNNDIDVDDIEIGPQVVVKDNTEFDDFDDFDGFDNEDNPDDFDDMDDIDEEFGLDGFGTADSLETPDDGFETADNFGTYDNFEGEAYGEGQYDEVDNFDAQYDNEPYDNEAYDNETYDNSFSDDINSSISEPDNFEDDPFAINSEFEDDEEIQIEGYSEQENAFNSNGEEQNIITDNYDDYTNENDSEQCNDFDNTYNSYSNSNDNNYNSDMNKVQSDGFIENADDNSENYVEYDDSSDFYGNESTNGFFDDTFEQNEGVTLDKKSEKNSETDEQFNEEVDQSSSNILGKVISGTAVAATVGAGLALGKSSVSLNKTDGLINTAEGIVNKGLSLAKDTIDNGGNSEMRISNNKGGSAGRKIQSQQTQQPQYEQNSDYIPGFDDDFDYDDSITGQVNEPEYDNYSSEPIQNPQGFDDYTDNDQQNAQGFNDYEQPTGYDDFETDDFGQDAYEQANMYNSPSVGSTGLTGEELNDFSDEAYGDPNNMGQSGQTQQLEQTQPVKKKGLLGGLLGLGKKNTQPVNNGAVSNVPQGEIGNGLGNGYGNNTGLGNPGITANNGSPQTQILDGKGKPANINKVRDKLKPFAARGAAIAVTGFGGSGTSTIAYGLANILCQLGYSILLVDFDVKGRTQSYITRSCYDAVEPESANIMAAVNSTTGIDRQLSIVKEGFHLLTMGLGADIRPIEEMIKKEKLNRFFNTVKNKHQFVIYDMPFEYATGYCSEITYNCDNIVLVADSSNWGLGKMMLDVCNIASEDMQDTMFNRGQVVLNKHRNMKKLFGHTFRSAYDILGILDRQVVDLVGDVGLYFSSMRVSGIIPDDPAVEDTYFTENNYSDTRKGQGIFIDLVQNIILNK